MATDKQIAAARANGARSRGPKTPEGKARAARNSTRHGMLAPAVLLEGESRGHFDGLVRILNASLQPDGPPLWGPQPRTPIEELLIGKMAAAHWRQMRIWSLERGKHQTLGDHEMRLDRQFFRTFDRYLKPRTFSGGSNPVNLALATSFAASEPHPEPKATQPEPKATQPEPD